MTKDGLFSPANEKSDFLVAYALLRKDCSPFGSEYARAANPEFLKRVLKGIATLKFSLAPKEQIKEKERELYDLLPEQVHNQIRQYRREADWINPQLF